MNNLDINKIVLETNIPDILNLNNNTLFTDVFNPSTIKNISIDNKKIIFESLLKWVNRNGINNIIDFLNKSDFYSAPSSIRYHSNYKSGLLDHSLLVCLTACKIGGSLKELAGEKLSYFNSEISDNINNYDKIPIESVILCSLLHDICKCGFYQPVVKYKKENSNWIQYGSYEINDSFPIGHGEKSVIMLQQLGLELNTDELLAIRWHMGSWDTSLFNSENKISYNAAITMAPLTLLIHIADSLSSIILEYKEN